MARKKKSTGAVLAAVVLILVLLGAFLFRPAVPVNCQGTDGTIRVSAASISLGSALSVPITVCGQVVTTTPYGVDFSYRNGTVTLVAAPAAQTGGGSLVFQYWYVVYWPPGAPSPTVYPHVPTLSISYVFPAGLNPSTSTFVATYQ